MRFRTLRPIPGCLWTFPSAWPMGNGTNDSARTVLLTDDSPMIVEAIGECLEAAGYQVLTARDGVEAVEVLARHQAHPHPCQA